MNTLPPSPFLYPILDDSFSSDLAQDAREAIRAGARMVQLRAKQSSTREVFETVKILIPLFEESNALLIVNDRVDLCMVSNASGVHLGQDDFPAADARALLPDRIIGLSTHNRGQIEASLLQPVDYIAVGPIYKTSTKIDASPAVGIELLRYAVHLSKRPVIAIGGIREENSNELLAAGVSGIALISELYKNHDLYGTICRMQEAILTFKAHEEI
jgi:thiamine-phosphate pyrophosphorylase